MVKFEKLGGGDLRLQIGDDVSAIKKQKGGYYLVKYTKINDYDKCKSELVYGLTQAKELAEKWVAGE